MTALGLAVLLLAATLPPRIDDQPMRVCIDAPKAIFWVENPNDAPVLASFRVERWSDEGDAPAWAVVQPDLTQRDARPKQVKSVKLEARKRRYVNWELKKRASPPSLVTGRHRLVLTWSRDDSQPPGTVTHEFVLVDCAI